MVVFYPLAKGGLVRSIGVAESYGASKNGLRADLDKEMDKMAGRRRRCTAVLPRSARRKKLKNVLLDKSKRPRRRSKFENEAGV